MSGKSITKNPFNIIVIVAALGYFVDIYDLILFGIVMKPSLLAIGIAQDQIRVVGSSLLDIQMIGMLVGGIVWGILGDKNGRLSTLFLTILLYSLANIANGFVTTIEQYKIVRFIAGFGLAGELGIGITLVAEVMTKESRGMGTSIVAGIGILGAVLGFVVAKAYDWQIAYFVGGGLGLLLLIMRISVYESGMFEKTKKENVSRGNFFSLFSSGKNIKKYLLSICIGIPVWFVISQLTVQSEAYAGQLGITGIVGGQAVMIHYIGASLGSLLFGFISEKLRSRKIALLAATISLGLFMSLYFFMNGVSADVFYIIIGLLGISMGGLWTVFMANASEQFGTNIRSTVTTTAPNFVRGTTVLVSMGIASLISSNYSLWTAGLIVGTICIVLSLISIFGSEESYGKDLDYNE